MNTHCTGITETGYRQQGDRKLSWSCSKYAVNAINPRKVSPVRTRVSYPRGNNYLRSLKNTLDFLKDELTIRPTELADLKLSLKYSNHLNTLKQARSLGTLTVRSKTQRATQSRRESAIGRHPTYSYFRLER